MLPPHRQNQRQNQHQPSRGITTSSLKCAFSIKCLPESTSTQSRDYNNRALWCHSVTSSPESTSTQSRDYNIAMMKKYENDGGQNQHQPSRGITTHHFVTLCATSGGEPESTSTQSRDYNQLLLKRTGMPPIGQNQHQPSRGITTRFSRSVIRHRRGTVTSQNQHQPSRGITTGVGVALISAARLPESTSTQSRDYNL